MKKIFGLGLLLILSSVAVFAAKNSQTFYLSTDVQAGSVQLPRGICEMTWGAVSGSQVQLTIKTEGKKTITIPARIVEEKQDRIGTVLSDVNGVTHLQEIRTRNARFIIESAANDLK